MVKVSGVPYQVDLPPLDDIVATLEQENRQMRARMDRLEQELREAQELIVKQNIENLNLQQQLKKALSVPNITILGEH